MHMLLPSLLALRVLCTQYNILLSLSFLSATNCILRYIFNNLNVAMTSKQLILICTSALFNLFICKLRRKSCLQRKYK